MNTGENMTGNIYKCVNYNTGGECQEFITQIDKEQIVLIREQAEVTNNGLLLSISLLIGFSAMYFILIFKNKIIGK